MEPRAQSFHHASASAAGSGQAGGSAAARPSPFASGPVATVNQARPQYPGNATQLSTPLVPIRRASDASSMPDELPVQPTPPPPPMGAYRSHSQSIPPTIDPFQQLDQSASPAFQLTQSASDLFPRAERSAAESLFGSPTPPGRVVPNQNLFGRSSDTALPGNTIASVPVRSTQSFSYGQAAPEAYSQHQPPPPAAPFLGYADNNARSQSFRPDQHNSISPTITRPSFTQRSSSTGSITGPQQLASVPTRVFVEQRSVDDLLDEFLRMPVLDQSVFGVSASPPQGRLTLAQIPDTVASLEQLYTQKRWKTLTKKSLSMLQNPTNDSRRTVEIKSWWLAGLIKDGHYENATSVLDQIGDLDDIFRMCSNNPGGDAFGPIRLYLLDALLSKCKGNTTEHEKKLFQLINKLRSEQTQGAGPETTPIAVARWLRIVQFTLVNHLMQQQKFTLALRVCSTIELANLDVHERVISLSRIGRMHLQMGDLNNAELLFNLARKHSAGQAQLEGRLILNDGLLLFAQNKLQEALSAFDSILHLESPSSGLSISAAESERFLEEDLMCSAVNNYAICALYCCDVQGAVAVLERMIRSDPVRFLNAVVVFNLSSLYDLIFDTTTSTTRKEMMKKVADLYDLEHIDSSAFRI